MRHNGEKEDMFLDLVDRYKGVIVKVCYMYATRTSHFDDLYQEVLVNLWQGMDRFRGQSSPSTWIYRIAINTCITWHRRNGKHDAWMPIDDAPEPADDDSMERMSDLNDMYSLISGLDPIEKAIIMMWLDEKSYDEICEVTGFTRANVATRIHRIKDKLMKRENS